RRSSSDRVSDPYEALSPPTKVVGMKQRSARTTCSSTSAAGTRHPRAAAGGGGGGKGRQGGGGRRIGSTARIGEGRRGARACPVAAGISDAAPPECDRHIPAAWHGF